jgi:CubicO group peptidase (beta-lactamase class C family)
LFRKKSILLVLCFQLLLLSACDLGPTAGDTNTQTPTSLPSTTPISIPTLTPIPTTAPYNKIPEQINDGWQTASLIDVGINPIIMNRMLEVIYHGDKSGDTLLLPNGIEKYTDIDGILIVKDDLLVFEEYFSYHYIGNRHRIYSATKSITSLLVGLAIEQGYLRGVDEKILPFFPEYLPLKVPDENKENITVHDLLTMRHGWECDDHDPDSATYMYGNFEVNHMDQIRGTLNLPMETTPSSHFSYCNSSTIVLGGVLAKATGMSLPELAKQSLFEPLGIESVMWIPSPTWPSVTIREPKWTDTGKGLDMRPRDMARIGLMMLHNGNWNGQQIIPADWIQESLQQHVTLDDNPRWGNGYGYLWWLSEVFIFGSNVHSFAAIGGGGQIIAVFPRMNMVVVFTGSNYETGEQQVLEILEEFILPAALGY